MKKILKYGGIVVLTPILLFILITLLLYFPPFQNWAIKHVASYASEKTGLNITIDRVSLVFPLDLGLNGLKVIQQNDSLPQVKDTVADVKTLVVNVQMLPLFKKQVEIDALKFNKLKLNTTNLVHKARVKGEVGQLSLISHGIDLGKSLLRVNDIRLADAKVNVELSDTVPPDTSKSKNFWKIYVDNLSVKNTDVTVHMPGDTLQVEAYMGKTIAKTGFFDLYKGIYKLQQLDWNNGRLKYDNNFKTRTKGLDYNHILLSDVNIGITSFYYYKPKLNLGLRTCSFKEKSGIVVNNLSGPVMLDSTKIILPALKFKTPDSELSANFIMDLNAFGQTNPGKFYAQVAGSFGKQDLMRFMGGMPAPFIRKWPNYPLSINGLVKGNMQLINFYGLNVKLPTAFNVRTTGFVQNPTNMKKINANVDLNAKTYNLGFITALLSPSINRQIRIPYGIGVKGNFKIDRDNYLADFLANQGGGNVKAKVKLNMTSKTYQARLSANNLQLQQFVPNMGLHPFTGFINAKGSGFDIMSPRTRLVAKARIEKFIYDKWNLGGMKAEATVSNGKGHADIDSHNKLLNGLISLDALMNTKNIRATLICDINKADLYNLRLTSSPFITAMCAHVDFATDMKDHYKVQGLINDLTITDSSQTYRPEDIVLDVLTKRDTTHAVVDCGDFHLNMDAAAGYKRLMNNGNIISKEFAKQLKERTINQAALRQKLPFARVYLSSGKENIVCRILKRYGIDFNNVYINMTSSPKNGVNGEMAVNTLIVDSVQLDTVHLYVKSDSAKTEYSGQICNNKNNPQYTFNALFDGTINEKGSDVMAKLYDDNGQLGVGFGIGASMESNGIRLRFKDMNPILGYKTFKVNDDNYLFLSDDRRVSANINLEADDGTGVQIVTNDENKEALQDITVSLNDFDLEKILSVIPYTPQVSGMMNGDFHVIQTEKEISVSSAISVKNMVYQRCPMGNVSTEFVYMPKSDGSHYVDGILLSEGKEVATLTGTYNSKGKGYLDAKLGLNRTPMSLVNGFIPQQLIGFEGFGEGEITMKGSLSKPQINGEVYLDSTYMISVPYGVRMRFANDPVRIVGSHLLFENFEMYANNDSPLNVAGYFDFSDLNNMNLNIRMRAQNFEIIDAKENMRSEAYGKAFVNFFGVMNGPLESLKMRGKLDVLGSTDVTYILRDSPLTTDNQLNDLVKFTNFSDTTKEIVKRPPLTGFDMDMTMSIDEGAHILCALNADKSNYVDLIGGGDLRMQYNIVDNLRLTGRYTLNNGEMKYSLPIIPLKTFTIQDGSYIEFQGDPMNPKLNITATEQTKTSVSSEGGSGRIVNFDCGVVITKTLKNMGLQFTIDAPEDMTIHNELQAMSLEERGKLAVTMLTTGMYLAGGNTNGFSMNNALSAFLQNQINTISGNALRTLDLSFGLDNATDASGAMHTDYSFKFAKRFWNNRLRIVIGGKVSTGSDVANENQSFFNNITFEYRLSQTSNKYLKLYYNRDTYDWLEGYLGSYGAGFMWRRKLQHFKDIFNFKSDVQQTIPPDNKNDSVIFRKDDK
jgi:hypothetical protein